ncbi:hypothetical protein E2562_008300 [Oryza meyeriana var. granulata]|uniref:Uncharacterized protein n=1 Tax=Oryza meyeriana var. granulata TaxID=110450 RepID=A0A6G1DF28_9ORYZ|nr:hypothetical protein E2562_008300 [Oryza meyeriana var. granulata]
MASAAALKMAAAVCVLAMCIGSQKVAVAGASREAPQDAVAGALLRELMEHELAAELGLADDSVGDICTPKCQTCLIVCAIKCVLKPNPAACYVDCIVTDKCFTLTMATE